MIIIVQSGCLGNDAVALRGPDKELSSSDEFAQWRANRQKENITVLANIDVAYFEMAR